MKFLAVKKKNRCPRSVACVTHAVWCSQGKLVYGNYGRREDLDVVQKRNVELKGCVLLVRAGKISYAEQVCETQMTIVTPLH